MFIFDLNFYFRLGLIVILGLKVWDWSILSASNSQLFEFDTTRFPGDYILPQGGVKDGLNLKSVILKPN